MTARRYLAMAREDDEVRVTFDAVVRDCATPDGLKPMLFVFDADSGFEHVVRLYSAMRVKVLRRADETVAESLARQSGEEAMNE